MKQNKTNKTHKQPSRACPCMELPSSTLADSCSTLSGTLLLALPCLVPAQLKLSLLKQNFPGIDKTFVSKKTTISKLRFTEKVQFNFFQEHQISMLQFYCMHRKPKSIP